MSEMDDERRRFLIGAGVLALGVAPGFADAREEAPAQGEKGSVTATEDLMREHGILRRILLVYEEGVGRMALGHEADLTVFKRAAGVVREFVEDYHEKLEENYLFPRFRKANKLVDLVEVLDKQHRAGRRLTDVISTLSARSRLVEPDRGTLVEAIRGFARMYRPHAAREDTVLFPSLRDIVSDNEFNALGETFEREEDRRFGERGFERFVDEVASLEKALGIYDIAQFTPR